MRQLRFLILLSLTSALATAQQDNIVKRFYGAWRLVSVSGQPAGLPDYYKQPTGIIMYDASGRPER